MRFDFIVIGAGISGASAAAELSRHHRVLLLEAEENPGFHATGRSGAIFGEVYGKPLIRLLSQASRPHFYSPPPDFADHPLVRPRGALTIANAAQGERLAAFAAQADVQARARLIDGAAAIALFPLLRPDYVVSALYDPTISDIDVDGLHRGYLRQLQRNGGTLLTAHPVTAIARTGDSWAVEAGNTSFCAPTIVNAAGAWADAVAGMASVKPIGLRPLRRTAVLVDPPRGLSVDAWPLVLDSDDQFYLKPDAGLLMLSPADETPDVPADVQPDEMDIAVAVDRVSAAADIAVRTIRHRWAGLRSFVADDLPVAGPDPVHPGFFWLVGQGGHGIIIAPVLARITAALATGNDLPDDLVAFGITAEDLSPGRLTKTRS